MTNDKPMIYKIAHKEFIETLRDRRFFVSALIVGGLLFAALALGWQHSRQIERQHAAAQEMTQKQWLSQGEKAPHSAAHYGVYAFKRQMPLAFIDRGVEAYTGVAVWLEAHKQNDFRYRPAQDQTALARFGELTAALVLQILLPLLIRTINEDVLKNSRYGDTKYVANQNLWQKVPEFQYAAPTVSEVFKRQIGGVAVLFGWFIISILAMIWATGRMKI